jgi:hypothetical protein
MLGRGFVSLGPAKPPKKPEKPDFKGKGRGSVYRSDIFSAVVF